MSSRFLLLALCILSSLYCAFGQQATGFITISVSAQQFKPQCSGGQWNIFGQNFNLAVTVQPFGGTAVTHQPMAETTQLAGGQELASIGMEWFLNGVPANVIASNTFNVGSSSTSGNVWTFMLMDDQPNIGGNFALQSTCTSTSAAPVITAAFFSNSFIVGVGAQGIPAVSATPVIANQLAAANQQTNFNTQMPTAAVVTTTAPASTSPTASASANGIITITVSDGNILKPQCNNGQWTIFGMTLSVSVTVQLFGGAASTHIPMAETVSLANGDLVTLNMQFFLDGNPATVQAFNTFGAGMSMTSANVWSFMLMDDDPAYGGTFTLGTCSQGQAIPQLTASFFCGQFIKGQGVANQGIPAVSAIPTIANQLQAANQASITGATTTTASPTSGAATTTQSTTTTTTAASSGVATGTIVFTMSGQTFQPQCNNGQWTIFGLNLNIAVTVSNGATTVTHQPMAETVSLANGNLATVNMNWFVNGAATNVAAQNTFNVADSQTNANTWSFMLMDDQPNIGGTFVLSSACTQGQTVAITASFSIPSTDFIVGQGVQNPFIPAVSALPTVVNALQPQNIASGSVTGAPTTTTTTTTKATTTIAGQTTTTTTTTTTKPTGTTTTNGAITITVSDANAFQPQCNNGQWTIFGLTMSVSVTLQKFGGQQFTTMPMAEVLGTANGDLATVNMQWFLNGAAATVTAQNTFNVGMSMTAGNVWSFMLMDDQPNIGGSISLASGTPCTFASAKPTITASFSCSSFVQGTGTNNLPAVSAVPTMVNKLQPANIATGSVVTNMPLPSGQTTTTTVAPTTLSASQTNGIITITVADNQVLKPQCNNGQWTLFGLTLNLAVTVQPFGGTAVTHQPMAETLNTADGTLAILDTEWFLNGAVATVQALNTFNVAMSTTTGNVWSFMLQDDQPNVGGTITLGSCTNGQAVPTVTAAFQCNSFVMGLGVANQGIPAVSATPNVVNALQAANIATGSVTTGAPSGTVVTTTTTTHPTMTTAANSAGSITINIKDVNPFQPICSNGQWTLFGVTLSISVTVAINGKTSTTQPMAEIVSLANGDFASINMNWKLGGQAVAVTAMNTFNVGSSTTSGNTWTFMLQDDQPAVGGTFVFASACTFSSTAPSVAASFTPTANDFIVGQGIPNQGVPAVSGVPTIINQLPAANQDVVTTTDNGGSSSNNTVYIVIGAVVGGALLIGAIMAYVIISKRQKAAQVNTVQTMHRDYNTPGSQMTSQV